MNESLLPRIPFPPKSHVQDSVACGTYYSPRCLEPVSFLWVYENIWELKNKVIDSKMPKKTIKAWLKFNWMFKV